MYKRYFSKLFVILFLCLIPLNVFAASKSYKDNVAHITGTKVNKNKVSLYFFHGDGCPHCAQEEVWLKRIKKKYKNDLDIYEFEVWYNEKNADYMEKVKKDLGVKQSGVPFTVIGDDTFVGYSDIYADQMENKIKEYTMLTTSSNKIKIPILGKVNAKKVSLPLVAVILGFIDGFNPCAMWILLFLINMFLGMKDKKKSWILGLTFLFVSAFVYFLSMLGINLILGVATINILKVLIGIFILIMGVLNVRKYINMKNEEVGCDIVDTKKRKKITKKVKKIMNSKSFLFSLIGIITLAVSVNLIELACSLGFPMIFTELLSLNNVTGLTRIIYLLIYIFFYMIDDMIVFSISMVTLEATGLTNKYNKLCTLISAIIMIIMGFLLLYKPEWLMLNF